MYFKPLQVIVYILMVKQCISFKTFNIAEENRSVSPWTSYKYLEQPVTDYVVREYILQEQDQK